MLIKVNQDPNMTNPVPDPIEHVVELDRIAKTFAKVKEFLEVSGFSFGPMRISEEASPSRKAALSSWTNHYQSLVMKPGHTIQKLYACHQPMRDFERRGTED